MRQLHPPDIARVVRMPAHRDDEDRRADPGSAQDADDPGDAFERYLLDRDHAAGETEDVTAEGQLRGAPLDRRLREETSLGDPLPPEVPVLVERDEPDGEPQLLPGIEGMGLDEGLGPEESAMHIDAGSGLTDHADDYVDGD